MKQLGDVELFQCRYVSDLFVYSTKIGECSSKVFIKSYIYSSISKRIASKSFMFESLAIPAAYDIIRREKNITRGNDIYPSYVMAWIGYIMMYFECATGIPQSTMYRKIKPEELYMVYEAYHSLDNELAIRRIAEAKNINIELNSMEIMKSLK